LQVQVRRAVEAGEDGLDFRGERERLAVKAVEERLLADTVARQQQFPAAGVPEGEGEHAVEALETIGAPADVGHQDDFGVAIGGEGEAVLLEDTAELEEVVDLAVEDDGVGAAGHGLVAGLGEVENSEAPVKQREPTPLSSRDPASSGFR